MLKNVVLRESNFWGRTSVIIIAGGYGFIMVSVMENSPTVAVVHDIIVHDRWRKGGLGNRLLRASCDEAVEMGAEIVRLSVEPDSWMEEWYGRHGFVEAGTTELDGHLCLVMEKEIRRETEEPQLPVNQSSVF